MLKNSLSFVLVGVGGQGTILASDVLAELGQQLGYDVKKAEVHGMSQRGGSVISHVRWGKQVFSPIIPEGQADVLVAFEKLESARFISHLKPGGLLLVNDFDIDPITVSAGTAVYPADEHLRKIASSFTTRDVWVPGAAIASGLGNAKAANVVLLGALSVMLEMEPGPWIKVIEKRVPPRFLALNQQAFEAGRTALLQSV